MHLNRHSFIVFCIIFTLLAVHLAAVKIYAQVVKSNCIDTAVGSPAGPATLPSDCQGGSSPGVGIGAACNKGGTGKDGAFQALTPGKQTLFSPWGAARGNIPGGSHQGVDLGRAEGTPIYAIEAGVVTKVHHEETSLGGITVSMKGDSGRRHYFAHMVVGSNKHINVGTRVTPCMQIGQVGKTGDARKTPPHLHYQISNKSGTFVDPEKELATYPSLP